MNKYLFTFFPNSGTENKITWERFGKHIEAAFSIAKKQAQRDYPDSHGFCMTLASEVTE